MSIRAVRAYVRGRVQGVGFRWFVRQRAQELGLCGHTRNLADGSVEVVVVGAAERVDELVRLLGVGPSAARVDAVECSALAPAPHYDKFELRL